MGRRLKRSRTAPVAAVLCAALGYMLVLAGCGDDGGAGPTGRIACGTNDVDIWSVDVAGRSGQGVIRVNTVARSTAFDPAFDIYVRDSPPSSIGAFEEDPGDYLGSADDEFECRFPPVEFSCPEATGPVDGAGAVVVEVFNLGSCRGSVGEYRINARLGGSRVPVDFVGTLGFE